MANAEHVQLVQRGVWNQWRTDHPEIIPDFQGADLRAANLGGANLGGANLHGANLVGADLPEVNLSEADLRAADLGATDLSRAKLRAADLRAANLSVANLKHADLRGAILIGADLSGAKLFEADLRAAYLLGANLSEANLSGAKLREADLPKANLRGASLRDADFTWANLTSANLNKAELGRTNFGATNLRDARGLAECKFQSPCILDHRAIELSGRLPLPFLRGCGLPDSLIEYLPSLLNEAIQFFSCFISYSHQDKPFARRLFDTLQGHGVRCWVDEKQMLPGDDIYEHVDRGIRVWDKVLLCCSKHSLSSWWVDSEINRAFEKERTLMKERGQKTLALIPLDLDGYLLGGNWESGKAQEVLSRMVADFRGWNRSHKRFDSEVQRVIQALRSDEAGRPPAPKPKL